MSKSKNNTMQFSHSHSSLQRLIKKMLKERIIFAAVIVLTLLYTAIALADFLTPYSENWSDRNYANAKPTPIYMIDGDTGQLTWPYVFGYKKDFNPETYESEFMPVLSEKHPVKFFVSGEPYKLWGVIPSNIHLFGVEAPGRVALLGNDINGRDIFSRMFYGGQISLTIGFLSLLIVFPIGMIYGGLAGYFGGLTDNLMMRFAEVVMSIPSIYLLIGLASILPPGLNSTERFALVTIILSFIGWASLSRVIRGMVLSIKQQEYVESARAIGVKDFSIIIKHILPQTTSFAIVSITQSIPGYILAESGLSFLGLGIQQPDASWGNLLKEAQNVENLVHRPEMMMPGLLIFIAVLAFNVIGDAVRDVMDPKAYARR